MILPSCIGTVGNVREPLSGRVQRKLAAVFPTQMQPRRLRGFSFSARQGEKGSLPCFQDRAPFFPFFTLGFPELTGLLLYLRGVRGDLRFPALSVSFGVSSILSKD